jgi:hypothetical protein
MQTPLRFSRIGFSRCSCAIAICLLLTSLATTAAQETVEQPKNDVAEASSASQPSAEEIRRRAEELILQLGDADYETRDLAEAELMKIAIVARDVLQKATENEDLEIAARAMNILSTLPEPSHTILDGVGNPIPFARVRIAITYRELSKFTEPEKGKPVSPQEKRVEFETMTDRNGRIGIETYEQARVVITVDSPQYGIAILQSASPERDIVLKFPLVHRESEAFKRAVKGQVFNSNEKPIGGAIVRCQSIRTPGQGLIDPEHPQGDVLTDAQGQFSIYMPSKKSTERGELIPLNSNFQLNISMPDSKTVPPVGGIYNNRQQARVVLSTEGMLRRFAFETIDHVDPTEQQLISEFQISYETQKDGQRVLSALDTVAATTGMRLVPGKYTAYRTVQGRTMNYQPIEVTETSHEKLTFKLPLPVTYRGRLVHGITGEPIQGGFVVGWSSSGNGRLEMLSDDDWQNLRELESDIDPDSDALKCVRACYGIQAFVRSEADGSFKLVQPPDRQFYGVMAFDEGMIPFAIPGFYLEDKATGKKLQRDYALFPAAKLMVNPIHEHGRLAVSPHWLLEADGQPAWIDRFLAATETTHGDFKYDGWMQLNELQPLFVPAGLKVRVRFRTPYSDTIAPYTMPETIQLAVGETKELGEIRFQPTLLTLVRVVDKDGNPVEGIPVRRLQTEENSWSIAHNTDANGMAQFGLNPNSTGKFRAGESHGPGAVEPTIVDFVVKEIAPEKTFELKLSDEQIRTILQK